MIKKFILAFENNIDYIITYGLIKNTQILVYKEMN